MCQLVRDSGGVSIWQMFEEAGARRLLNSSPLVESGTIVVSASRFRRIEIGPIKGSGT